MESYKVKREYAGKYVVIDDEGDVVAGAGKFMPGPMVSVSGPRIVSPGLARAVARAMTRLAADIEKEVG